MGFFDAVGKAFAGIGRWGEKQRYALQHGSGWEDQYNREQVFLDDYVQRRQQAEEEDRIREEAEAEYKAQERKEQALQRQRKAADEALSLTEKFVLGGVDPTTVDPAIYSGTGIPQEAYWQAASEKIKLDQAAKAQAAEKGALDLENIRSLISHRKWEENKPEKGPAPERPRTRGQAEDDARAMLGLLNPSDPLSGKRTITDAQGRQRPMTIEDILDLADKLQGKMPGAGRDTEDILGSLSEPVSKLAKAGVNPAETGGNPAGQAAAKREEAPRPEDLPPVTKTASGPNGTIFLRGGVWYDAKGVPVR